MFNFLKICGKGILAILLSPFWLSAFLLTAVFGLILFIINSFRILFIDLHNFFRSNAIDPLGDLPEDLEVLRIKKANEASLVQSVDSTSATTTVVTASSPTPISSSPTPVISQETTVTMSSTLPVYEEEEENQAPSTENLIDKEEREE